MIPRYSRPDMLAIWSPDTRFRIWFEIEAHAADAMAELGIVPKAAAKKIWAKGKTAKFKSVTEIKDADTVNFNLFMVDEDGKDQPLVKITYKRKK